MVKRFEDYMTETKQQEWDRAAQGSKNPKDPRVEAYHDMAFKLRKMPKEKLADLYKKRKGKDESSKDPVVMGEWQAIKDAVVRAFKSLNNISEHHIKPGTMVTAKQNGKTIKGKVVSDTSSEDGTESYKYILNVDGKKVSVPSSSITESRAIPHSFTNSVHADEFIDTLNEMIIAPVIESFSKRKDRESGTNMYKELQSLRRTMKKFMAEYIKAVS